ncbi:MAG: hypothetical protein E6H06_09915, partial [Bacteroidetes bacterium]
MRQIALLLSLLFLFLLCFSRQHKPADSNRSSQNISSNHRINDSLHSMRKSADSIQQLQDTTQSKGLKSYVKEIEHELSVHLLGHALWFLIGLIATFLFLRTKKLIVKSRYRKVFGNDIKNFTIVYPNFTLMPVYDTTGNLIVFPYVKGTAFFRMTSPISTADMRAAQYLSEAFYKKTSKTPEIVPDTSVLPRLNFSYCAVGGIGNEKTNDILNAPNNLYFNFDF